MRGPATVAAAVRRAAAGYARLGHVQAGQTRLALPAWRPVAWAAGGRGCALMARPVAAAAAARAASSSSTASLDGDDAASTSAPASKVAPKVSPDVAAHWDALLADLQRPAAIRLAARCDTSRALGLPATVRLTGVPSLIIAAAKGPHPTKVALTRVGEFYEAYGADAVLLVEHAGLNPMGEGVPIPKAGCPAGNLRRTLADLVDGAGLSVVVIEEAPQPYAYGTRARAKTRYVGGVVTPACPVYLGAGLDTGGGGGGAGAGDAPESDAAPILGAPPVLGVAAGPSGFTVIEASVDLRTVSVSTGQTEDAVSARLYAGGLAPPLYLHSTAVEAASIPAATTPEAAWEARVSALFRREAGAVARYGGSDPVAGLLAALRRDVGLPPDAPFATVDAPDKRASRPSPLLLCTATQLGLHQALGVPSLVDALLPPRGDAAGAGGGRGVGLAARRWLRDLLLRPPEPAVADGLRAACGELRAMTGALPRWQTLPAAHVALKLRSSEPPSADFFRELAAVLGCVQAAATEPHLAGLATGILPAMAAKTGTALYLDGLAAACDRARAAVGRVVLDRDGDGGSGGGGAGRAVEAALAGLAPHAAAALSGPLADLVAANEAGYEGQVSPDLVGEELGAVSAARARVAAAAAAALEAGERASGGAPAPGRKPALEPVYDSINNALWLKPRRAGGVASPAAAAAAAGLAAPLDRYGGRATGRLASPELETAVDDYRRSTSAAKAAVRETLRALTTELAVDAAGLVSACAFSVIAAALTAHTRAAVARGWTLPETTSADGDSGPLSIEAVWPYWLDGAAPGVVKNDLTLGGMALLTGPNMAGKSTVLRCVAAVALLASCGLHAPVAGAARIPRFDQIILRAFAADAPTHGRSSFAVEMDEMRAVLTGATDRSLVLVDELGKGTEACAGSALAGAMLEHLACTTRCTGVFATHLHALLDLPLAGDVARLQMLTTTGADGRRAPAWKVAPGVSTESLALETAAGAGVPGGVVQRAAELYGLVRGVAVVEDRGGGGGGEAVAGGGAPGGAAPAVASGDALAAPGAAPPPTAPPPGSAPVATGGALAGTAVHVPADGVPHITLLDAAAVLHSTAAALAPDGSPPTPPASILPPGCDPPAQVASASVVYVVRREDGYFYCGETDGLLARLDAHRARPPVKGGRTMAAAYVALPSKTAARSVEAATIQKLLELGVPMLSVTDAKGGRVGRGAGVAGGVVEQAA